MNATSMISPITVRFGNLEAMFKDDAFSGAEHNVHTPRKVIEEVLSQTQSFDDKKILVLFNPEWLITLSGEAKVPLSNVVFYSDHSIKTTIAKAWGAKVVNTFEEIEGMKFDIVVGNPPYGRGANLAIQFLNKAAELSDVIYFVLPRSVRRPTRVNRVSENLHLESDNDVSDKAFSGLRTCWQKWVRSDQIRPKVERYTSHPDFEWLKKGDPRVNVFMGRTGSPAGKVLTNGYDHYNFDHYYICAKSDEVVKRLVSLSSAYVKVANQSVALPTMSKHDVIDLYVQHYGHKQV